MMAVTISCRVGQTLDRIGEGLLIDVGVFCADAVADGAIVYGGKFESSS